MMLSTDLCLAMNGGNGGNGGGGNGANGGGGGGGGRGNEPLLAQTHNCCAWLEVNNLDLYGGDEFCGGTLNAGGNRGGNR